MKKEKGGENMNRQIKQWYGIISRVFNKVCEIMADDTSYQGKNDPRYYGNL
jgi:hypothetical protein